MEVFCELLDHHDTTLEVIRRNAELIITRVQTMPTLVEIAAAPSCIRLLAQVSPFGDLTGLSQRLHSNGTSRICIGLEAIDAHLVSCLVDQLCNSNPEVSKCAILTLTRLAVATDFASSAMDAPLKQILGFFCGSTDTSRRFERILQQHSGGPLGVSLEKHNVALQSILDIFCGQALDCQETFSMLRPMTRLSSEFSETIMRPLLWKTIASLAHTKTNHLAARQEIAASLHSMLDDRQSGDRQSGDTLDSVLKAVHSVRECPSVFEPSYHRNLFIPFDFFLVAEASCRLEEYHNAIMFAEIWKTNLEESNLWNSEHAEQMLALSKQSFRMVDDPDLVYGIDTGTCGVELASRIMREGRHLESLMLYDSQQVADFSNGVDRQISISLWKLGLYHVCGRFMSAPEKNTGDQAASDDILELQWEVAWKNSYWNWNMASPREAFNNRAVFSYLRDFVLDMNVRQNIFSLLEPGTALQKPHLLTSVEIARLLLEASESTCLVSSDVAVKVATEHRWRHRLDSLSDEFGLERMFALRMQVYRNLSRTVPEKSHDLLELTSKYATFAVKTKRIQLALNLHDISAKILREVALDPGESLYWEKRNSYRLAVVLWEKNEKLLAMRAIQGVLGSQSAVKSRDMRRLLCKASLKIGCWAATIHSELPDAILQGYFEPAISTAMAEFPKLYEKGVHQLATFCDSEYDRYVKSDLTAAAASLLRVQEEEIQEFDRSLLSCTDNAERRKLNSLRKKAAAQLKLDQEERAARNKEFLRLFDKARTCYLRALAISDRFDLSVYRFASLWFGNVSPLLGHTGVTYSSEIGTLLRKIESRKFVPLIYQLSARVSKDDSPFQRDLADLIQRMCVEHPHHCLYQIIALNISAKDDEDRRKAASAILQAIRQTPSMRVTVDHVVNLVEAYNQIAYMRLAPQNAKFAGQPISIDPKFAIRNLADLPIPVTTLRIPVRKDLNYDNVVTIRKFSSQFTVAGGINLPKILLCYGSDGKRYKVLVKGNDDLRQDAVLMQIFDFMNVFLRDGKHKETKVGGDDGW